MASRPKRFANTLTRLESSATKPIAAIGAVLAREPVSLAWGKSYAVRLFPVKL